MNRRELVLLGLIFLFGFLFRLYHFSEPIADWHAWRQVDTSSVSRNFATNGFDLIHPKYHDLSNVPSGIHANPEGYRFVEFPIYNLFQAGFYKIFGILTIEEWGRIVTILSSLFSAGLLFLIARRHVGVSAGLLTSFFFTFIPFNIYYGRVILPDSSTVTAFLAAIYFFDKWVDEDQKLKIIDARFLLALFFAMSSLLLKPFAAFFMLPMLYLVFDKFGINFIKKWQFWFFAVVTFVPLIAWRIWMLQYPGGIPQSGWLLNGNNIRFKGAFFQWIFAERISNLILGYWGLSLLILGLLFKSTKKSYFFFLSFIVSSLLYITVVATGNVQHDYYQILIMPSIAIYLALGSNYLLTKSNIYKPVSLSILLISILFMFSFGWFNVRAYYNIDHHELIRAGQQIDKLIPKDSKVLVPTSGGDTTALYFMNRTGWSSFEKPLPQLIKMGAEYLVFINPTKEEYEFGSRFKIVGSSPDFVIFNLRQSP